jgi:hypothetical protein
VRPTVDPDHGELMQILGDLTREDVDITAHEVARRHSTLKHASNFTRNKDRAQLISIARHKQEEARAAVGEQAERPAVSLGEQLARAKATIKELEEQRQALVASHAACVRAVMRLGGMSALEKFWKDYKAIGDTLLAMESMPSTAEIIPMTSDTNASKEDRRGQS